ncbi:hypothetical protein B0182_04995 [Moraxella bovis]|nr:hypothetical protein B0182_04995 [Moraxella bovis]
MKWVEYQNMNDDTVIIEFANYHLHIAINIFMPYQDIEIFPVSFSVDDCACISADNLRLCRPYPNKYFYVVQQKPSYRGRNENGLLFLIPHPKADNIKVTVLWGWKYRNYANTAIQEIEFTIEDFKQNQPLPVDTVITTDDMYDSNIMVFTRQELERQGLKQRLKSVDTRADFWCWDSELGLRGDFVRHIKQKSTLKLMSMSDFEKIDKIPYVFQGH